MPAISWLGALMLSVAFRAPQGHNRPMDDPQSYRKATPTIECDHPRIQSLARDITQGERSEAARAGALFVYARDTVAYSPFVPFHLPEHYLATATLDRGRGYCVQKAAVLVTLARAVSIPAKLVFADMRNHQAPHHLVEVLGSNLFVYHCYASLFLAGQWLDATPAFDTRICQDHGLPVVHFDGTRSAIFPTHDEAGRPFAEYVRHHGAFADIPMEPMLQAWEDEYGAERVLLWKEALATGQLWRVGPHG